MDSFLETIDLDIEEANELLFKVRVEGIDQAPAKVRLVLEESGDQALMFSGSPTPDDGVVQFMLPILKGKLKEGQYLSRVEVLIENRYFAPVQFNINLKQAVKVVAEAIRVPAKKEVPRVSVTASAPIVVNRKSATPLPPPEPKPIVVEAPVKAKPKPAPAPPPKRVDESKPFAPRVPGGAAKPSGPARQPTTLKERYAQRSAGPAVVEGEELIRELARSFVRGKK
jgi:hypothetical protein